MNKTQKIAVDGLILSLASLLLLPIPENIKDAIIPFLSAAIMVICIFFFVIYRLKQRTDSLVDERDIKIKRNASYFALISLAVIVIIAIQIAEEIMGPDAMVPLKSLERLTLSGVMIYIGIYSAAILIQYGRGGKENE